MLNMRYRDRNSKGTLPYLKVYFRAYPANGRNKHIIESTAVVLQEVSSLKNHVASNLNSFIRHEFIK